MTASLCDIVFGCLVRFLMNDETRSLYFLSAWRQFLFASRSSSLTELNQGDDTLSHLIVFGGRSVFTQHRVEYGVVLEGWGVHEATQLRFEVAFKHDTVDATNIAIQAVHGKRVRHWHVKLHFQNTTMVWFKAVRHLRRLVNFPTRPNNHTVYLTRGPACECMDWTTVCCR